MSEVEDSHKRNRPEGDDGTIPTTEEEERPTKLIKLEETNGKNTNGNVTAEVNGTEVPKESVDENPTNGGADHPTTNNLSEVENSSIEEAPKNHGANPGEDDDPPMVVNNNDGGADNPGEGLSNPGNGTDNPGHNGVTEEDDPPATEPNETTATLEDLPATETTESPSTLVETTHVETSQPDEQHAQPSGDAPPPESDDPTTNETEQHYSQEEQAAVKVEASHVPEHATTEPLQEDLSSSMTVKEEPFTLDYSPTDVPPPVEEYSYDTSAAATQAAMSPSNSNPESAIVEERGEVPAIYIGRVIGKGGEMIRDLQARAGCRMDVDPSASKPGASRIITYRGTRKTVDFAKHLVQMLCSENVAETDLPLGEAHRKLLVIPAHTVGKIIGRGGEMIRELQSRSQARIQVDHSGTSGLDPGQKQVTITGSEAAVIKGEEMVLFLVNNPMMDALQALNMLVEEKLHRGGTWGSGPPYPNLPNQGVNMQPPGGGGGAGSAGGGGPPPGYGGGGAGYDQPPPGPGGYPQTYSPQQQPLPMATAPPMQGYGMPGYGAPMSHGGPETELFRAPRVYLGRIIGAKGVTINDLQRRTGCDIQINQDSPHGQECEISIRGSRQGIEMVKQMIREIIDIGPNHPYAGGADQQGGYPQGGYGQGGGYQQGGYGYPPQPYGYQNPMAPAAYGQPYEPPYQPPYQGYGGGYDQRAVGGYYPPAAAMHQPYPAAGQPPYGYEPPPHQGHQPVPVSASAWQSATAPDGQVYYYNERTGETQWEKPMGYP